jgi:hypothetical protein
VRSTCRTAVEGVEAVLRAEASFVVDDLSADRPAMVHLARPLRPEQVYRGAVTALIEAIRTAPGHVLTHRELQRIAATAGVAVTACPTTWSTMKPSSTTGQTPGPLSEITDSGMGASSTNE